MKAKRGPRLNVLFGLLLFAALPYACSKGTAEGVAAKEHAPAAEVAQR